MDTGDIVHNNFETSVVIRGTLRREGAYADSALATKVDCRNVTLALEER